MIRVIQLNLNHTRAAQDLLIQRTKEEEIDVALLSEPHRIIDSTSYTSDTTTSAAILTSGNHATLEKYGRDEGFVRAKVKNIYFYSCYASPSWTIGEFQNMLDKIVDDARSKSPIVIGGDFNAWALEWGSRFTNERGARLLESFANLNVTLVTDGSKETFSRAGRSSIIDITFVSNSLLPRCKSWISDAYTHSDHQAVIIEINDRRLNVPPKMTGPRWKDAAFDRETFALSLEDAEVANDRADSMVQQLTKALTTACDASMPRRKASKRGAPCYWWNDEIKSNRTHCFKARRKAQRARNSESFERLNTEFKEARKTLEKSIRESKRRCFKQICDEADINPWGTAYRMVMTKFKGQRSPMVSCPRMLRTIVEHLFPRSSTILTTIDRIIDVTTIPPVTIDEVLEVSKKIKPKKAPGPDGFPNVAIKTAMQRRPDLFRGLMQKCLDEGTFPTQWKMQNLVLLPKGNKPLEDPSSHRPICLLDTMGKALERIIYERLLKIAEERGALSDSQFGFRKGRSTIDAIKAVVDTAAAAIEGERWRYGSIEYCAVVTLDIKNAFNSADWVQIRRALTKMETPHYLTKIVEDYFRERKLKYHTDEGEETYEVTAGVPQGSVLGPLMWNLMYDGILRLILPKGVKLIGFADDIAVIAVAKYIHEVEAALNEAVDVIKRWLATAGLELADHKTEAVLITGRKVAETMTIRVGQEHITSTEKLKYLGVIIDNRLNFKSHVEYCSSKASKMQAALARIMPNIGGPNNERRLLISRVVSSVLLYAAPIWATTLATKDTRRRLSTPYRLAALRNVRGFRTISDEAAFVLAGMIPIDILASEMRRIYQRRNEDAGAGPPSPAMRSIQTEERINSMSRWQDRWNSSSKGRWTYKLIQNIDEWTNRPHGTCCYHVTQFLSGHGGYRKYLHKFGHDDSAECPSCNTDEDTEHVMFNCERFGVGRPHVNPTSIVNYMLQSNENWETTRGYVADVHNELRRLEKIRREQSDTSDEA